ncbi:tetratricopeptide repeat protein [Chitinimonas lacunae]|uniref:Tetratricopeptide repeat protein n=1 Tax=Chitinimonas lacunae TaxID=1963018 RepID=A0ABV8MQ20_9NEIS
MDLSHWRKLLPAPEIEQLIAEASQANFADPYRLLSLADQAIAAAQLRPDPAGELRARFYRALALNTIGHTMEAIDEFNLLLDLARAQQDMDAAFAALRGLGIVCDGTGCYDAALDYLRGAEQLLGDDADEDQRLDVRQSMAIVYSKTQRPAEAAEVFLQLVERYRSLGRVRDQAINLSNAAICYAKLGRYEQSLDLSDRAEALVRPQNWPLMLAIVHGNRATPLLELERYEEAQGELLAALHVFHTAGHAVGEIDVRTKLGRIYRHQGDPATAALLLELAVERAAGAGLAPARAEAQKLLVSLYREQGDFERALLHSESLRQLERDLGDQETQRRVRQLQTELDLEHARRDADEARRQRDRLQAAHAAEAEQHASLKAANSVQRHLIAAIAGEGETIDTAHRRAEAEVARATRYHRPLAALWLARRPGSLLAGLIGEDEVLLELESDGYLLLLPEREANALQMRFSQFFPSGEFGSAELRPGDSLQSLIDRARRQAQRQS